jgi:hypothetical protein
MFNVQDSKITKSGLDYLIVSERIQMLLPNPASSINKDSNADDSNKREASASDWTSVLCPEGVDMRLYKMQAEVDEEAAIAMLAGCATRTVLCTRSTAEDVKEAGMKQLVVLGAKCLDLLNVSVIEKTKTVSFGFAHREIASISYAMFEQLFDADFDKDYDGFTTNKSGNVYFATTTFNPSSLEDMLDGLVELMDGEQYELKFKDAELMQQVMVDEETTLLQALQNAYTSALQNALVPQEV